MTVIAMIVAIIFFIAGVAGTVLPVLPGAVLIWLGMFIYGLLVKFENLTLLFFIGQGLAVGLIFFIDYLASVWGVKRYGGSSNAVWGSITGGLLGVITLGPFGLILGPFIGAVAGELLKKKTLENALHAGVGTIIGFFGGTILKLSIEALMIIWFFLAVFN